MFCRGWHGRSGLAQALFLLIFETCLKRIFAICQAAAAQV